MSRFHAPLNARRWERTRRAVFYRDRCRCRVCGLAGRLECDHVVPLQDDPDQDPYDPDNCQTLCRHHHIEKTRAENFGRRRRRLTAAEQDWKDAVEELMVD